jgi:autotransporter-associated beta strand protein
VNITFDSGNLLATNTIALNVNRTISLAGAGTIDATAGVTAITIAGLITGPGALNKGPNASTVILGAASNSYAGGTNINGGTLSVPADNSLGNDAGAPTNISINGGSLLASQSFTLNAARTTTLGASGGTFNAISGATLTIGGVITGSGALGKGLNTSTVVLLASNNYTGGTNLEGGTLQVGNGGAGANLGGGAISSGGALVFNHSDAVVVNAAISGAGSITQTGTGTLTLGGKQQLHRHHDDFRRHAFRLRRQTTSGRRQPPRLPT